MVTIKQMLTEMDNGMDFYITLGDFLDEFYRQTDEVRKQMLADEPGNYTNVKREHLALFAATAHKLANDYGFNVPPWVWDKKYYMKEMPFFDCNARGNLRLLFLYKSPTEFKHRNLFVDENFLMRV